MARFKITVTDRLDDRTTHPSASCECGTCDAACDSLCICPCICICPCCRAEQLEGPTAQDPARSPEAAHQLSPLSDA